MMPGIVTAVQPAAGAFVNLGNSGDDRSMTGTHFNSGADHRRMFRISMDSIAEDCGFTIILNGLAGSNASHSVLAVR